MAEQPKPKRGMPRAWLYGLIPGGFILLVLLMSLSGMFAESDDETEMVPVLPEAELSDA